MQGRSVVVDLTAHENTTLDVKNSNLIDVLYTWGFGSYKAKIEIKGKQKGETDIVVIDHETRQTATIKNIQCLFLPSSNRKETFLI